MTTLPKVELIACRPDKAKNTDIAHIPVKRDWHEDLFHEMLEALECDGYGYADKDSPLSAYEVAFEDGDPKSHYVIDTPLFTLRPFYWGNDEDVTWLPNFVYKPWSYEISWYKHPMRSAYANFELKDEDFVLMCQTCMRAKNSLDNLGSLQPPVDDFPRMNEQQETDCRTRKRLEKAWVKSEKLENLLMDIAISVPIEDDDLRSRVRDTLDLPDEAMARADTKGHEQK